MSVSRFNQRISNQPSGGGNKLQGLPPTTNKNVSAIRMINISSWGPRETREKIICMNQLGGVGTRYGQFGPSADGTSSCIDPYIDFNLSISEDFSNSVFENNLFSALEQVNVAVINSGPGMGKINGFLSASGGNYPTPYYVHFSGPGQVDTSYSALPQFIDPLVLTLSPYKPRSLQSMDVMDMINTNNLHGNREIISFTINSITISWIAGNNKNGGDKPDISTYLYGGQLTAPENLWLQFVDQNFHQIGELTPIWSTKDPIFPIPKIWAGHTYFNIHHPGSSNLPPYPNGTAYVPGQGTAWLPASPTQIQEDILTSINGGNISPQIPDFSGNGFPPNPTTWTTTGPFYKPVNTYYGNDPTYNKFTETTFPINLTIPVTSNVINNIITYGPETARFRIFQERSTHILDEYGVRFVRLNITYKCKR